METPYQKWKFEIKRGIVNPFSSKGTLEILDQMIEDEKNKLEQLEKQSEPVQNDQLLKN
jgi:hypothetical protein